MAQNNILLNQYRTAPAVQQRNAVGLNQWAGATAIIAIPGTKPAADWVRARLVAERIPSAIDAYVQRTIGYFLQDPATTTNIWEFLNFGNEATEVSLSSQVEAIINAFMPRFAAVDVSQSQVDQWYADNGFAEVAGMAALEAGRSAPAPPRPQ
jgi:hypothetical protein